MFVDPKSKRIALTALKHIVELSGAAPVLETEPIAAGATVNGIIAQRVAGVGLQLTIQYEIDR